MYPTSKQFSYLTPLYQNQDQDQGFALKSSKEFHISLQNNISVAPYCITQHQFTKPGGVISVLSLHHSAPILSYLVSHCRRNISEVESYPPPPLPFSSSLILLDELFVGGSSQGPNCFWQTFGILSVLWENTDHFPLNI